MLIEMFIPYFTFIDLPHTKQERVCPKDTPSFFVGYWGRRTVDYSPIFFSPLLSAGLPL